MNSSIIRKIKTLPPLPKTIVKMQEVCADPESSIGDLIKVIDKDPMIVANLLKAANSPLYSFGKEIKSVAQAVSLFGMAMTRSIALGNAVRKIFDINLEPYGLSVEEFAELSHKQSLIASKWYTRVDKEKAEVLFLTALLQESGKILIADELRNQGKEQDFRAALKECDDIAMLENEVVDSDTAAVATIMFEHWKFDDILVETIKYSENPTDAPEEVAELSRALKVIKTVVNVKGAFSEENIAKGLVLAKEYGLDTKSLKEAIVSQLKKMQ